MGRLTIWDNWLQPGTTPSSIPSECLLLTQFAKFLITFIRLFVKIDKLSIPFTTLFDFWSFISSICSVRAVLLYPRETGFFIVDHGSEVTGIGSPCLDAALTSVATAHKNVPPTIKMRKFKERLANGLACFFLTKMFTSFYFCSNPFYSIPVLSQKYTS